MASPVSIAGSYRPSVAVPLAEQASAGAETHRDRDEAGGLRRFSQAPSPQRYRASLPTQDTHHGSARGAQEQACIPAGRWACIQIYIRELRSR